MTLVSSVVVAYGNTPLLDRCVEAILSSSAVEVEVVVVDNGSTDGSVERLPEDPRVRKLAAPANLGFGGGCNLGAESASGDVIAFINPDAVVCPQALVRLSDALEDEEVGIATARLRMLEDPDVLNAAGLSVHFLGLGWCNLFGRPAEEISVKSLIPSASGAAMAVKSETFKELGGFTPQLFLYHEDVELSIRAWIAGLKVVIIPDADVMHDYQASKNPEKLHLIERNRLCLLLSCYELKTLILLAPALVAYEVGMAAVALTQGWFRGKLRGWLWLAQNRTWLFEHRRQIQGRRRVTDRELVPLLSSHFDTHQIDLAGPLAKADSILARYWSFISRFV